MESQKRFLEVLVKFKAVGQDPTRNAQDSDCLEFVEAMEQAGMGDVEGWLRAQSAPEIQIRNLLSAAERSKRLGRLITEGIERMRVKEQDES